MAPRRTGLVNNHASKRTNFSLSATTNLSMATWNCGGLSKLKKDLCVELDYDILEIATSRLTNLDTHAKSLAGMVISVPKTKAQHIMHDPAKDV